jgi:hypothetical protein
MVVNWVGIISMPMPYTGDISCLEFRPPRVGIKATVRDTECKHQKARAESHPEPAVELFDTHPPPPALLHHYDILLLTLAFPLFGQVRTLLRNDVPECVHDTIIRERSGFNARFDGFGDPSGLYLQPAADGLEWHHDNQTGTSRDKFR